MPVSMKIIALIIGLLISYGLAAQGKLEAVKPILELKDIKADDQPFQKTYTIKNTGNKPFIITRVVPMTTLLKADWDRQPVAPGKTAIVRVSFIPANMPQKFHYRIQVYSTADNNRTTLEIQGNITDNPEKPELLYKCDMDGIKFKTNGVNFNKVYTWQVVSDTLPFINTTPKTVEVGVMTTPEHIRVKSIPAQVAPGQKGKLIITYNAPLKNDYGYTFDSVVLSFNNEKTYRNRLSITANLEEDFSRLTTQEKANAPVVSISPKESDFGTIRPGEKAHCDFTLTNQGKRKLIIRKTKASCGCTAVTTGSHALAPGKSTSIRVTFDSKGKSGRQYKSVSVFTNDPQRPEITINIKGEIRNK